MMSIHAFRLHPNQDLRNGIIDFCNENDIEAAALITVVGSLKEIKIRLSDGKTIYNEQKSYEIVSMTGTIAENGVHFHIGLSGEDKLMIGGHVKEGCIIKTTAEIVLLEIKNYDFRRITDDETGFEELVVLKK